MTKTRVTLVRHGETEWNVAMRLQGIKNSNLTQKGVRQAQQAVELLKDENFNRLIVSDLQRAIDTAKLINEKLKLPISVNPILRERNFGIMEGLDHKTIQHDFPDTWEAYIQRKEDYVIPNGESLSAFYQRIVDGINGIADEYPGENLLLVTHGGVLDCMIRMIFNFPISAPRTFSIYNASINIFFRTNNKWKLECWGKTSRGESLLDID